MIVTLTVTVTAGRRADAAEGAVAIARTLTAHGIKSRAVLPTRGAEGVRPAALLEAEGVEVVLAGAEDDAAGLADAAIAAATDAEWIVFAGSLPPGAPSTYYAGLLTALRGTGARLALDTAGAPLINALGARPDLIAIDRAELTEAANREIRTLGDVVRAAQALRRLGARAVLADLGADGLLLVDDEGALHGEAGPRSAGDAALAGFLSMDGTAGCRREALRTALSWSAADRQAVLLHDRVANGRPLAEPR